MSKINEIENFIRETTVNNYINGTTDRTLYGVARYVYTTHVKPLEDALAKSEADKSALVETLEKLARLGNGDRYGNSVGNCIAQDALARVQENS